MRLYNRHNEFVGIVINPAKRVIKQNLGGMHYFEWEVPVSNPAWDKIELEGYVVVQGHGRFTIKEKVTHGTSCSVKCIMSVDEIIGSAWNNFHSRGNNITDTFKLLLDGTGWTAINHSTNTEVRNCYGNNVSSWDMLQRVCNIYQIECEFDTLNKYVTIKDKIGTDSGTLFISRLNLKQMKTDSHSHNMVTKLKPIGKDGLTVASVNGGSDWITNFTYTDKVMEAIWEQTRYEDAQSLKDDAVKYLAELAIPYEVYEVDVVDLGRLNTHQHLVYGIGDIVTIREQDQKLNVKQRIVYNEIWIDDMGQNKINVANKDMSFEDYYKRLQLLSESLTNTVNEDGTIATGKVNIPQGDLDISAIPDKSITGIKIKDGAIEASHIKSESIQTRHLVSGSVTADIISAGAISSRHLAVGAVGANNIQAGAITAGSAIIANGAIGSAQIGNIDAGKITSGSFNTDFIQIGSTTQKFLIDKETLQIKDANNTVRVQIGKTGTGTNDYSMSLWDAQGHLMFDASGLQEDGIKSGIIRNDMVSDTANINGSKLNIASVITKINDDTSTTFKASKITLDGANQTLDVAFTQINNTQTSQGTQISNIQSSINGITTTVGNLQTDNTSMKSEISQIKQEAGVISSSVTQINQKFDNLQFGGRNKVLRSKTFEKTHWYPQDHQVTEGWSFYQDEDGSTVAKVKNTDGVGHLASLYCERMFGTKGDTNTISFEVKCPSWADVSQDVLMGMIYEEYRDSTGGDRIYFDDVYFSSNDSNKPTLVDNKWIKFSYTKQVQNEDTKWISFRLVLYKNGELHFKLPKMEDGTVATAWSPAPEDLEVDLSGYAQVDFVRSEITQSAKDIKLEVSNSYTTKTDFNNLTVGGRNYALKSRVTETNNHYPTASYNLSPDRLGDQELLTIQVKGTLGNGKTSWGVFNSGGNVPVCDMNNTHLKDGIYTRTVPWQIGSASNTFVEIYPIPGSVDVNSTIEWIKIEKGSKATDWTPAPEDIDFKFNDYTTTVDMDTKISLEVGKITQSVTATYVTKSDYNTKVSELDSKITQTATDITSTVSAGYTTKDEFNKLTIGGRNHFKKTSPYNGWDGATGSKNETHARNGLQIDYTGHDAGTMRISEVINSNGEWTVSGYIFSTVDQAKVKVQIADVDAWNSTIGNTAWTRFEGTVNVTNFSNDVFNFVDIEAYGVTGSIYIVDLKVEKGNKATEWTPAPEDMEVDLTGYYTKVETDSQISQTATNITSTVSNTYTTKTDFNTQVSAINSKIDQSASAIRLEVTSAKNDAISSANASTDDKLSKVAVGGTNLFLNTKEFDNNTVWTWGANELESDRINGFRYTKVRGQWGRRSQVVDVEPNTEYTLSAWIRRDTSEETEPTRVGFYIPGYPPNDTQDGTIVKTHNFVNNDIFPPNVWKRIGVTYRTGANTTKCYARFESYTDNFNDHRPSMWMYGLKLEKGNVMTDWSPNPDDLELYPSGRNLWKWSTAVTGWEQDGTYVENAYELQHKIQPDLTPIDPKKKLFVQVWNPNKIANSANSQRICWYNADKAFISSVPVTQLDGSEYIVDMYTPPALARYTRLAVIVGSVEAKQIDPGIKVMIENADVKGEWSIAPEDIDSNFKDMEVGGRNFLVGSKLTTYADYNQIQANVNSEAIVCIWNPSHTGNIFTLGITGWIPPKGTYTLSGYVLLTGAVPKDKFFTERANSEVGGDYETYYDSTTGYFEITQEYNGTSPWVIHAHTTRVGGAVGFVTLKKLKFEKGNKATDWTQAPEDTDERVTKAEASITVLKDQIIHKVEVDDVKSVIQQNPDSVRIGFNGITNNVVMASTGITINNGALVLKNRAGQNVLSADAQGNLLMNCWGTVFHMSATGARGHDMSCDVNDCLNWTIDDTNIGSGIKISTNGGKTLFEYHPLNSSNGDDGFIWMGVWTKMSTLSVIGDTHVGGDFTVGGAKHCVVETENYGTRKLYAYETAESYFGDIGDAVIGDDGIVVVDIEDIFSECVTLDKYHVFTQCYTGNISKITRHPAYFTVEGEPGTEFSWELKAKRKGYESDRLGEFKKEEKFYGQ